MIKVNVTEKPLSIPDFSLLQAEETQFVDSPYKVYVGNLAKEVTSDILKEFFSEKANAVSAKISRVPGTSKSSGYGFVSFSSEEDVETAVSSLNNAVSSLPLLNLVEVEYCHFGPSVYSSLSLCLLFKEITSILKLSTVIGYTCGPKKLYIKK